MPLPAALAARLAKRGLVKTSNKEEKDKNEEVFAESYDDPEESDSSTEEDDHEEEKITEVRKEVKSPSDTLKVFNCPNRSNPYHTCSSYCKKKFGAKSKFEPHPILEKRRIRMLKIYPLPPGWVEVPDLSTNRYYYWNPETDQVSWFSPAYPKAKIINKSQPKVTTSKGGILGNDYEDEDDDNEEDDDLDEEEEEDESGEMPVDEVDELLTSYEKFDNKNKKSYHSNDKADKNKRARKPSAIDPMDPASYSDVPRGKWSAGLEAQKNV